MALNAWFDRLALPRTSFDVGTRRVPAFRSLGIVGFHVAVPVAILAGLRNGTPLVTSLGVAATAGLSFFAWALVRRWVTGGETLVLVEYVWAALAFVAAFVWLSGVGVAPTLDVFAVAVCPFLAFGRLGCVAVGCCHGVPGPVGPRYGAGHAVPDRLVGRRLLPVPLVEAVALAVVGAVGLGLVGGHRPGAATVWFLAAYAVVRFGLERARGDRRPILWGVPVAQALCVAQLGVATALAEAWLVPGPPGRATWTGASVLVVVLGAGLVVARRTRDAITSFGHLQETWLTIVRLAGRPGSEPAIDRTSLGLLVAVSEAGPGRLHVSLSHPRTSAFGVGLGLAADPSEAGGITHLSIARPGTAARADASGRAAYFDRPRQGVA